jgi:hypothetical protein
MAKLISLKTFTDERGNLTVIDNVIPFDIKRIFYIYRVDDSQRGKHRHHTTIQAAICLRGSCKIFSDNNDTEETFSLDTPDKCLIIYAEDWHFMYDFTPDAILMILASTHFDPNDYIYMPYEHHRI